MGNRHFLGTFALLIVCCIARGEERSFPLEVRPAEHRVTTDPATGAELTFLTNDPAADTNLYFHERSWLADESLILFCSARDRGGLMGYCTATGELVYLRAPEGAYGSATAQLKAPGFYALRGDTAVAVTLENVADGTAPTRVTAYERVLCTIPACEGHTSLNENADGTRLSIGCTGVPGEDEPVIFTIDTATGALARLCGIGCAHTYATHVQWSRTDPHLLSLAGAPERLWVVDTRNPVPHCVYRAWPDELVTHESWWVDNQLIFCGGIHPKPTEDSHVKVLDLKTGTVRIVGAGSWWEEGTSAAIARRNWWHAAGSEEGRWIAADNWHGDIRLFEGKTTRPRWLTRDHRTYGSGEHPHVGWDRSGKRVIFTSHQQGNPDVCIATIPEAWQKALP